MRTAFGHAEVDVKELPIGVRIIAGIPTSIAASIGGAQHGPTSRVAPIDGSGDLERILGGAWRAAVGADAPAGSKS